MCGKNSRKCIFKEVRLCKGVCLNENIFSLSNLFFIFLELFNVVLKFVEIFQDFFLIKTLNLKFRLRMTVVTLSGGLLGTLQSIITS